MTTTDMTLVSLFDTLPSPDNSANSYSVCPIPGTDRVRLGKDAAGNPALLVRTVDAVGSREPAIILSNLTFRPECLCRVLSAGSQADESLSVLSSALESRELREYFLYAIGGMVPALSEAPTTRELAVAVERLAELFRSLSLPSRTSVQGLWAELLLILQSADIAAAVRSWHRDPRDQHDFTGGVQQIEVKSTTREIRAHHFSLAQLLPQSGVQLVVVSYMLTQSISGDSVEDLWEEIRSSPVVSAATKERTFRIIASSLGSDWRKSTRVRYERRSAELSRRLYDSKDIPRVDPDLPSQVRDVHFSAELTEAPTLKSTALADQGGLFSAVFRERDRTS